MTVFLDSAPFNNLAFLLSHEILGREGFNYYFVPDVFNHEKNVTAAMPGIYEKNAELFARIFEYIFFGMEEIIDGESDENQSASRKKRAYKDVLTNAEKPEIFEKGCRCRARFDAWDYTHEKYDYMKAPAYYPVGSVHVCQCKQDYEKMTGWPQPTEFLNLPYNTTKNIDYKNRGELLINAICHYSPSESEFKVSEIRGERYDSEDQFYGYHPVLEKIRYDGWAADGEYAAEMTVDIVGRDIDTVCKAKSWKTGWKMNETEQNRPWYLQGKPDLFKKEEASGKELDFAMDFMNPMDQIIYFETKKFKHTKPFRGCLLYLHEYRNARPDKNCLQSEKSGFSKWITHNNQVRVKTEKNVAMCLTILPKKGKKELYYAAIGFRACGTDKNYFWSQSWIYDQYDYMLHCWEDRRFCIHHDSNFKLKMIPCYGTDGKSQAMKFGVGFTD